MKALIFSKEQPLRVTETEKPAPKKGELLIKLSYAALNHLDLWIWKEQSPSSPVIPGSDGSGVVEEVGEGVTNTWLNKEVIVNPGLYWGTNEKVQSDDFEILGYPTNGTFAEYIAVPADHVYEKPGHLSLEEAAALPMGGVTAYRSLFSKAQITSTDKVLITGIGGGVALYLLQMAKALGCMVYVTSSSQDKIQSAMQLGASGGFNYKNINWTNDAKTEAGGFDVIIDSAGGNGFPDLTEVANPAARIVLFGRTSGNINNLKPGVIYNKQLTIMGSVMGSSKDFKDMLDFYSKHQLQPVIHKTFDLENTPEAFEYMNSGQHFGKITIKTTLHRQNH